MIQGFVQTGSGKGTGFLIPLGHVELFVQRDQRRGHRVDDAVEVVLETSEFLLDLAPNLDFQFQLAIGVTGLFGKSLGLVISCLGIVPCTFELLLTGFDPRKHGVEGFGEAADFIVITASGAQGVVLLAGHLSGQLFELVDRLGDQALDLLGDQQPQQHTEDQNPKTGSQGACVERHRQFAAGHQ